MAIQKFEIKDSVKQLYRQKDKFNFNLAIQRNLVWNSERKSLLIHSLIYGYPVPPIHILDNSDNYFWVLDGKQRLSTIFSFLDEQFALDPHTPDIEINGETYQLANKFYSTLPEEVKDILDSASLSIWQLRGITEEERDELFKRMNAGGMPLTRIELMRAVASSKVMEFVREISNERFFKHSIALTDAAKNRFTDEEVIFQIMDLVYNDCEPVELSSNEVEKVITKMKVEGIPDFVSNTVVTTTDYLNKALPAREKFLKKVNIPMIFITAISAQERGIEPEKFGGWVQSFFERLKVGSKYSVATKAGSAKKENVKIRLNEMKKDFEKNIDEAPEYKIPEEKPKSNRGRRPKNKEIVVTNNIEDNNEVITEQETAS